MRRNYGKPHIWTVDEMLAEPRKGWFYGLCRDRDTGHVHLGEILPGFGWSHALDLNLLPLQWVRALKDVFGYHPAFPGDAAIEPAGRVMAEHGEMTKEFERVAEIGKTCTHPNAEDAWSIPGNKDKWCPDCWELIFA